MAWEQAWGITARVSYTNHTLMPEALETWPCVADQHVLPRHLEIIFRINQAFLGAARAAAGRWTSLAPVADRRRARRAPRAHGPPARSLGGRKVNGVSALHSTELLVETIFADFARAVPGAASPT